jgi:hypothetical protein
MRHPSVPWLALGLTFAGCIPIQGEPLDYADTSLWLCRPDLAEDHCRTDLSATEVRLDGSLVRVPHEPANEPDIDCFYVYPTVTGLLALPGNETDLSDVEPMVGALENQAARFSEMCEVYAPLYRQATLASYATLRREAYLKIAYRDVEDAFDYYLEHHNQGRPIVLLGHSQGGDMVARLLKNRFDPSPSLRERLVVAMPIGATLYTEEGELTGGSFEHVPLCTDREAPGCVVSYRAFDVDQPPTRGEEPPDGQEEVCVNPVNPEGGERRLSRTYLPTDLPDWLDLGEVPEGVDTKFALYRELYSAECQRTADGRAFLGVRYAPGPGDTRDNPIHFEKFGGPLGLHVLDVNLALGDLIDLAKAKATAFRERR